MIELANDSGGMMTREERARLRLKVAAGTLDFVGVLVCAGLILWAILMIAMLAGWLTADLARTFSGLTKNIMDAIVMKK